MKFSFAELGIGGGTTGIPPPPPPIKTRVVKLGWGVLQLGDIKINADDRDTRAGSRSLSRSSSNDPNSSTFRIWVSLRRELHPQV